MQSSLGVARSDTAYLKCSKLTHAPGLRSGFRRYGHSDIRDTDSIPKAYILGSQEGTDHGGEPARSSGWSTDGQVSGKKAVSFQYQTLIDLKFTDMCLLLGCDYLEPIKGVGPKSAYNLIREHGTLGEIVEHLREQ